MGNNASIDLTNSVEVLDVNIYIDKYINENKNTENYAKMVGNAIALSKKNIEEKK